MILQGRARRLDVQYLSYTIAYKHSLGNTESAHHPRLKIKARSSTLAASPVAKLPSPTSQHPDLSR